MENIRYVCSVLRVRAGLWVLPVMVLLQSSCRLLQNSNSATANDDPGKVYRLRLNLPVGSTYYYSITNESAFKMEFEDKKVSSLNRSMVGLSYKVGRDSAGDYLLDIMYDKVHVHTKTGEGEDDLDADSAKSSVNQVENLLGYLKGATIRVVLGPGGEMRSVNGYDVIKEKIMGSFRPEDTYSKNIAERQWDQQIKAGLIQKNMEQLFRIFPDSAVHVGDKWRMKTEEHNEINLRINSEYTLKSIHDGVAVIQSDGEISSADSTGSAMGYNFAVSLKGRQEGQFEVQVATGMVVSSSLESQIEGDMDVMGRKVPMRVSSKVEVLGRPVN